MTNTQLLKFFKYLSLATLIVLIPVVISAFKVEKPKNYTVYELCKDGSGKTYISGDGSKIIKFECK